MDKDKKMELTEGSVYKITSLGGRDILLETEGVFKGFISIGVDEIGLIIELGKEHKSMKGKIRIIPLHVLLSIDVIKSKPNNKKEGDGEMPHYVG